MTKLSPHDPGDAPKRAAGASRAKSATPVPAPGPHPRAAAKRAPAFERGAKVRVTRGPFAGRTGVVQELVGRRSARVMLGPLPVQIDVEDLAPGALDGRGRPRLASSHRKPVPARS